MTDKAAQEAADTAETKVKGTMVRILRWVNGRIILKHLKIIIFYTGVNICPHFKKPFPTTLKTLPH